MKTGKSVLSENKESHGMCVLQMQPVALTWGKRVIKLPYQVRLEPEVSTLLALAMLCAFSLVAWLRVQGAGITLKSIVLSLSKQKLQPDACMVPLVKI